MSDVISQVKAMLTDAKGELTQAAIARESGLSEAVLSALLAGSYGNTVSKDTVARHESKLKKWLSTRAHAAEAQRRIGHKKPVWQPLPTADNIMEVLKMAQTLCRWGMVYEGAGVGKTVTAEHYKAEGTNVWILTACPFRNSETAVLQSLMKVLGQEFARRTRAEMSEVIEAKFKGSKGLLIIDEAQYYSDRVLNGIRILAEGRVGVVLLGNDVVRTRMSAIRTLSDMNPVWSRVISPLRIFTASPADIVQYLKAWGITDKDIIREAKRVIPTSAGALRSLESAVMRGLSLADVDNEPLSLAHFKEAWRMLELMKTEVPQ